MIDLDALVAELRNGHLDVTHFDESAGIYELRIGPTLVSFCDRGVSTTGWISFSALDIIRRHLTEAER